MVTRSMTVQQEAIIISWAHSYVRLLKYGEQQGNISMTYLWYTMVLVRYWILIMSCWCFFWSCLFWSKSLFVQFNKLNYNNNSIESLWSVSVSTLTLPPEAPPNPVTTPGQDLNQFRIHQHKSTHLYQETKQGHHQCSTYCDTFFGRFCHRVFNCWNYNKAFKIQDNKLISWTNIDYIRDSPQVNIRRVTHCTGDICRYLNSQPFCGKSLSYMYYIVPPVLVTDFTFGFKSAKESARHYFKWFIKSLASSFKSTDVWSAS